MSEYLLEIGTVGLLIAALLFWRMAVEVNGVLPGRISLAVREDWYEVKRLHRKCFPTSGIRIVYNVLGPLGTSALVIATILRANSK
jgi:hypothetical protein